MGIFDSIKHAIFGDHGPLGMFNKDQPAAAAPAAPGAPPAMPMSQTPQSTPAAAPQAQAPAGTPAAAAPAQPVDVEAILEEKAKAYGRPNNWRTSIVDLLALLGLDSSLAARKELANELNVHVGADGSAEENIALHKAVMQQLAANGGKVPADMLG